MAESNKSNREDSSSEGVDTDKFETPPQSADESGDVNVNKLMLGNAYEQLDDEARENLEKVQDDINTKVFEKDDQEGGADSSDQDEELKARHDSSEDEVQTNIDDMLMYTVRGEDGQNVRVLKYTSLFLPDSDKRRAQMVRFNRKKMGIEQEVENMSIRQRKRELKESQKRVSKQHCRKTKYLPVNPFLEDFYYLQGFSKAGIAPQTGKKLQAPSGYRHLYSQSKVDNPLLEKISHSKPKRSALNQKQLAMNCLMPGQAMHQAENADGTLKPTAETGQKKDFTLDACQINELKGQIVEAGSTNTENETAIEATESAGDGITELRKRLRLAKNKLQAELQQKLPKLQVSKIERQSFALLSKLRSIYDQNPKKAKAVVKNLPSEVDIYELAIDEKFKQVSEGSKRVKFWGELKDTVSEHQMSKDAHLIKRQEQEQYQRSKKTFNQPVFSIITPAQGSAAKRDQANNAAKDQKAVGPKPIGHPQGPQMNIAKAQEQSMPGAQGQLGLAARVKRPQPLVVEKSDFDLVNTFDEYEKLKQQEQLYYQHRKKTQVSAESIMRHVRWKMGRLSDKDFFQLECEEIKREQRLESEKAKSLQRQQIAQRRNQDQADAQASKSNRTVPVEFQENLDDVFNSKRFEIQANILRRKTEKERASMQKQNTTQTPAYEPIVPDLNKESDEEHAASDPHHKQSDKESSSSDSDSDSGQESEKPQDQAGHSMMPSIADELNHAQCIKDLSFFKLSWKDEDLETFHRPNIQSIFQQGVQSGKMAVNVVQHKKDDKETRLNPHLYFKERYRLSLNRGKFSIFEHIDQHPLFVNNFGMASRLRRYFYGDKVPTKKDFLNQKNENVRNRHIGPSGKLIKKAPLDRLEMLLGQVDKSKFNGITLLENNLYNAPVFYHRMPSTSNDFFCSVFKRRDKDDGRLGAEMEEPRQMVIRSLNSFYTVGQIEPKREVFNPQSRHFTHFIKQQSKAYTTRLLQENKILSFQDIRQFFPEIQSPVLKKGLKEIEVEQDRNGYCKLNANFDMERHKDRMTPEMICQYESAIHGQYRLAKIGIQKILSADKISYSTHKFCFEETDLILQRVAKLIESEVLQTPWNLSSNYIKIKQEGSMMMLEGQGDPSCGHGGYSYLKMPLKISADSIQGAKANRMNLNPAIQNPKAVTGTEADLRKLKKDTLHQILLEYGVSKSELDLKSRWEMVAMLRCYASQNTPDSQFNQSGMKSFYARGVRNTSKKQQEMYNKRANSTFRTQMETLSDPNPKNLHEVSEEEPDFTQLPDLEAMGLQLIGRGFGTSLSQKEQADPTSLVQAKGIREPGENAKDFTRDIYILVNDEQRKQIVEVEEIPEIKTIENIKDYLKLFLVIHPNALSPQQHNPSGINIGGVSSNAEFMYAMSGNGSKEWEKKLLEKLNNREISKKCEILCHKIRSMTQDETGDNPQEEGKEGEKTYERVIFQADEKAIKKFKRCMNKNKTRQPRRTNRRSHIRAQTRPLNEENLRQADRNRQGKSGVRSTSRSITSASVHRANSTIAARTSDNKARLNRLENVSQGGQGSRSIMNSGSKPKSKKRSQKFPVVAQPSFRITNNGVVPGEPSSSQPTIIVRDSLLGKDEHSQVMQSNPEMQFMGPVSTNVPQVSLQVLPGEFTPMSQPTDQADATRIQLRFDTMISGSQPQQTFLENDENQVMDSDQIMEEDGELESGEGAADSKNLVNHSNLQSDYEPDPVSDISSEDFETQQFEMQVPGKLSGKKKRPSKKNSIASRYQNLNLVMSRQTSLSRKNSRGTRKGPTVAQKFKPHGFSNDDFEYQNLTASKSRRRQQQDGTLSLNNMFIEIIEMLWNDDDAYYFQNQPTRQQVPNYREKIRQPIALKDMKNRAKRNEYKSRALFEQDFALMVENAETFNGADNYISQKARNLQARASEIIESKRGDIETMECVIQMDGAGQI